MADQVRDPLEGGWLRGRRLPCVRYGCGSLRVRVGHIPCPVGRAFAMQRSASRETFQGRLVPDERPSCCSRVLPRKPERPGCSARRRRRGSTVPSRQGHACTSQQRRARPGPPFRRAAPVRYRPLGLLLGGWAGHGDQGAVGEVRVRLLGLIERQFDAAQALGRAV
jgi:hypothetical protein